MGRSGIYQAEAATLTSQRLGGSAGRCQPTRLRSNRWRASDPASTNLVNFIKIQQIESSPNFKIDDFTVHRFKIFEK
jgi:hypothetical protein